MRNVSKESSLEIIWINKIYFIWSFVKYTYSFGFQMMSVLWNERKMIKIIKFYFFFSLQVASLALELMSNWNNASFDIRYLKV